MDKAQQPAAVADTQKNIVALMSVLFAVLCGVFLFTVIQMKQQYERAAIILQGAANDQMMNNPGVTAHEKVIAAQAIMIAEAAGSGSSSSGTMNAEGDIEVVAEEN